MGARQLRPPIRIRVGVRVRAFGGPAVEASAEERSTDGGAGLGRQTRDKDFPLKIRPEASNSKL